ELPHDLAGEVIQVEKALNQQRGQRAEVDHPHPQQRRRQQQRQRQTRPAVEEGRGTPPERARMARQPRGCHQLLGHTLPFLMQEPLEREDEIGHQIAMQIGLASWLAITFWIVYPSRVGSGHYGYRTPTTPPFVGQGFAMLLAVLLSAAQIAKLFGGGVGAAS